MLHSKKEEVPLCVSLEHSTLNIEGCYIYLMHKTRCLRIFLIFDLTMQKVGGMMTDVKGLGLALSMNVVGY